MIEVEIIRQPDQTIETKGALTVLDGQATLFNCDTLELAWKNNQHGVSCYPPGVYICEKIQATDRIPYQHISITNVPDRFGICMHKANFAAGKRIDLEGCTALGFGFADINADNIDDITNSGKAFDQFMAIVPQQFKLTVR